MTTFTRCISFSGFQLARAAVRSSITLRKSIYTGPSLNHFLQGVEQKKRSNQMMSIRYLKKQALQTVQALSVGDKVPEAKFNFFDAEGTMQEITTRELCAGKLVVLFAVPGAFTPTCSTKHLPGFIEKAEDLKAKGVDTVACVSVNDAFVMDAWGKSVGAGDKVLMLADGSALFAKALGVELDLSDKGLGIRSRRYAMLLDDMVIKVLNLEEGGAFTVSSAEEILSVL